MTEKRLIVGLGNPGKDYENTRHNIGFRVVGCLGEQLGLKFSPSSLTKGLWAQGKIDGKEVFLLLPLTWMNHSGVAVKQLMQRKKLIPEDVLVVSDDFHLLFGQLRFRTKGSDGGHNGLGSIIQQLGDDGFPRLRVGIGQPKDGNDITGYVLGNFTKEEKGSLGKIIKAAATGCQVWSEEGIHKAMEQFNKRNG